jgi:hypothetical protein
MLRIDIKNLRFGKQTIGNLAYIPYQLYVDDYLFREGDVIVDDGEDCYIEMTEDRLFDLAYEL